MDEERAKEIGEEIRDLLAFQDEEIIKAEIDGSVGPNKFKISYADKDDRVSKIETRLQRPEKWR